MATIHIHELPEENTVSQQTAEQVKGGGPHVKVFDGNTGGTQRSGNSDLASWRSNYGTGI